MTPHDLPAIPLNRLDRDGWKTLWIGLLLALVFFALRPINFVLSILVTLVHEMGHTVFYWLYGYPSIPSFDLTYGGGVTHFFSRNGLLIVGSFLALLGVFPWVRRHRGLLITWFICLTLHAFLSLSQWHECVILAMGHGTELAFAGLCLYRMFGARGLIHDVERPLYGMIGFFIWFKDLHFAGSLMLSSAFRAAYGQAKGGGHWMDFSQIARDFLHVPIEAVAFIFFVTCLIIPALSFWFFRHRNRLLERASNIWDSITN